MKLTFKLFVRLMLLAIPGPVILMLAAGDTRWTMGWVFAVFSFAYTIASRLLILLRNPDLVAERSDSLKQSNVEPWDRLLVPLVGVLLPTAAILIAGLDRRFRWTAALPLWVQAAAYLPMILGIVLAQWAAMENAFFSAVVRIQEDRGQTVVATGPYRFIRHPGYAGSLVFNLFLPLALGSVWVCVPVFFICVLVVLRTSLEDRTLKRKLPGYGEYAERIKKRLVPRVW
jgi:protein-S-isoprenylcysteine O-methyltransferase Ste14